MANREIARAGYAYVAVSAQQVGVEGGDSLIGVDMSLKAQDPERYSRLHHPGDKYSYDIYSQVGRLIREVRSTGLKPESVLAVGESQSATFLTTYVNGWIRSPRPSRLPRALAVRSHRAARAARNVFEANEAASRPVPFPD